MATMDQLSSQDRLQPCLTRHIEKSDRAIEPIGIGEGEELVSLSSHGLTENLHRWNTRHRRIGRMGMEMDQGHSTTPSISNGLLSKPDVEGVESDGEPLRPLLLMLLIDGSSLKERALLGIAG